ncbi:hypothetical protein SODALDRAFT_348756 [Sodiomyces alkalinus F11]|uniref:Uncharacterized protein n=1 Tax=Sodiomyces alkalinus (strain CBS 110278 / VKM F-3762 / F11) TaxID=1314773 RepID=A0A3N2Q1G9_SODAK|nr:hypothetical protein SODALDRAFT_348756 [Sodiomyces alkalinus F11]ROT40538.1 hypothetical protein SODALDRAFT_348756 [Sodiomyces alkalinus F11]
MEVCYPVRSRHLALKRFRHETAFGQPPMKRTRLLATFQESNLMEHNQGQWENLREMLGLSKVDEGPSSMRTMLSLDDVPQVFASMAVVDEPTEEGEAKEVSSPKIPSPKESVNPTTPKPQVDPVPPKKQKIKIKLKTKKITKKEEEETETKKKATPKKKKKTAPLDEGQSTTTPQDAPAKIVPPGDEVKSKETAQDQETPAKTVSPTDQAKSKTTPPKPPPKIVFVKKTPPKPPPKIVSPTDLRLAELSPLSPGAIPSGQDYYIPAMQVIAVPELLNLDDATSASPTTLAPQGQHIIAAICNLFSLADELQNHPALAEDQAPRRSVLLRMRDVFGQTDFSPIDVARARQKLATARRKRADYQARRPNAKRKNGKTYKAMVAMLSDEVIPRLIQREADADALRGTLFQVDYVGGLFVWWLRQVECLVSTELQFAPRAEAKPQLSTNFASKVQVAVV